HPAELLEAETWRVIDWLDARVDATVAERVEGGERQQRLLSSDVIIVILDGATSKAITVAEWRKDRRQRERLLAGATLLIDAKLGGLNAGLLDDKSDEAFDVTLADQRVIPFRVRKSTDADEAPTDGWRVESRIPIDTIDEQDTAWLV